MSEVESDKAAQHPKENEPAGPQKPNTQGTAKDSKAPPKMPPPKASVAATTDSRGSGKGLAGLALLVGLAGLAAGGYSVWQTQQLTEQERQQLESTQATREQARQVDQRSQELANRLGRLEQLPSAEQLEDRRRLCPNCRATSNDLRDGSNRCWAPVVSNGGWLRPSISCEWRCCVCRPCKT